MLAHLLLRKTTTDLIQSNGCHTESPESLNVPCFWLLGQWDGLWHLHMHGSLTFLSLRYTLGGETMHLPTHFVWLLPHFYVSNYPSPISEMTQKKLLFFCLYCYQEISNSFWVSIIGIKDNGHCWDTRVVNILPLGYSWLSEINTNVTY